MQNELGKNDFGTSDIPVAGSIGAASEAGAAGGASSADRSDRADRPSRVPWPAVAVFVVVSFGLAWLVALPLWMKDQAEPGYAALFQALAGAMMFTPTIAMLVVVFAMRVPRGARLRFLGIWPLRPAKRVVWFIVGAWLAPIALVAATLAISSALGWVKLDLQGFSGLQQVIDAQFAALDPGTAELAASTVPPIAVLAALQIATIPLIGLLNLIPALGEELGWRGWLLPALRPLGVWPALLVSGAIWGLWHSPVILLGYNFNRTDLWGVVLMTLGCTAWGVLFGWLRLRSGSIWPSAIGHATFNAAGSTLLITLVAADQQPDMMLVNPLGAPGWIVLVVVVAILALTGQFKREPQLAPKRTRSVPPPVPPHSAAMHS